jgi:hypothetical protein
MAIELRFTSESAADLLRDLKAFAGAAVIVASPETPPQPWPVGHDDQQEAVEHVDSVAAPVANGPVVQFPEAKAPPRRGRPPKAEPAATPSAQIAEEPQVVTPDDCIEAVKSLVSRTGDILAPGHVLGGFGVKKTRELTDTQRAGFVAACAAYVAEGAAADGRGKA